MLPSKYCDKMNTKLSFVRGLYAVCLFLDKIWLKKAEEELGENETVKSAKLKQLQERIVCDENIPPCRRDNAFLLRFLRVKKFDVEKSYRMVNETFDFTLK